MPCHATCHAAPCPRWVPEDAGIECHVNKTNSVLGLTMYFSYFVLFFKLFIENYVTQTRKRTPAEGLPPKKETIARLSRKISGKTVTVGEDLKMTEVRQRRLELVRRCTRKTYVIQETGNLVCPLCEGEAEDVQSMAFLALDDLRRHIRTRLVRIEKPTTASSSSCILAALRCLMASSCQVQHLVGGWRTNSASTWKGSEGSRSRQAIATTLRCVAVALLLLGGRI